MSDIDFRKLSGWPFWWLGLALTIVYTVGLCVLFSEQLSRVGRADLTEIGSVLSGVFAPLAFIWLVVGLLQQGRELNIQMAELRASVVAQRTTAEAASGQTKLQNEQFIERTYRLYREACCDTLFHLLQVRNFRFGPNTQRVISESMFADTRDEFEIGRKDAILSLARAVDADLQQYDAMNAAFAAWLPSNPYLATLSALSRDFQGFDDRRLEALSSFVGGDVLRATDEQAGFQNARNLVNGLVRAIDSIRPQ